MSFLGLGNFGTGFVTGFAESANKALQDDINRINSRIDSITEFKLKRAIDEQDKRKDELEEIEKALRQGASVYGDPDSQEALAFAAGILKKEGSLDSYQQVIDELKARQRTEPNFNDTIKSLVNIPKNQKSSDVLTRRKVAESFLGPAKSMDARLPEGFNIRTGIVGKLFGEEGVQKRLQTSVKDELMARNLIQDDATGVLLPENYFNQSAYILFNMTPSQRVDYYTKIINSDTATEEEKQDATNKVKINREIVRKEKFETAEAGEKVIMLTTDFLTADAQSKNTNLSSNERVEAKNKANKALQQLGMFNAGKEYLQAQMGGLDEKIAFVEKQYFLEKDRIKKEQLETELSNLKVEKRKLSAFGGTQAEQVAFAIDEAIRTNDASGLSKALEQARKIDGINEETKNIELAERVSTSRAINQLAVQKLEMNPIFGVGTFEITTSGTVAFIGREEIREKAKAELVRLTNEVAQDAINVASTEREKQLIREVANITSMSLSGEEVTKEPPETEEPPSITTEEFKKQFTRNGKPNALMTYNFVQKLRNDPNDDVSDEEIIELAKELEQQSGVLNFARTVELVIQGMKPGSIQNKLNRGNL